MTLDERRLAVGILLSLAIGLRLLAARQARTWEHGDGLALLIGDALVAGAYAVAMGWVLGIRLKDEEAMMAQRLGPEWDRFRSTRGRVIPRWR